MKGPLETCWKQPLSELLVHLLRTGIMLHSLLACCVKNKILVTIQGINAQLIVFLYIVFET